MSTRSFVTFPVSDTRAVADLHSEILDVPPPTTGVQILSISYSFWEKFGKIVCWRPLESWRPNFGEILDPSLKRAGPYRVPFYL